MTSHTSYPRDTSDKTNTPANRFRRQFIKGTLGAAAGAALVVFGWTKYLFPPQSPHIAPVGGTPLGKTASFVPGAAPTLLPNADNAQYSVQATAPGQFIVLTAICTHQGCSVGWDASAKQFLCPCHAGRFDTQGHVVKGPPKDPLASLPCHVQGDTLYLDA